MWPEHSWLAHPGPRFNSACKNISIWPFSLPGNSNHPFQSTLVFPVHEVEEEQKETRNLFLQHGYLSCGTITPFIHFVFLSILHNNWRAQLKALRYLLHYFLFQNLLLIQQNCLESVNTNVHSVFTTTCNWSLISALMFKSCTCLPSAVKV